MPKDQRTGGRIRIMVELRVPKTAGAERAMAQARALKVPNFELDPTFSPISMTPPREHAERLQAEGEEVFIVRGTIDQDHLPELEAQPTVVKVWRDTPIAPFPRSDPSAESSFVQMVAPEAFGSCPIAPCDCDTGRARGTLAEVAEFLGMDRIWANGFRGQGVVIGIVDGGISAIGRTPSGVIPRVSGGFPANWGTMALWDGHGNMTATDAGGMAPEASLFDIRIASSASQNSISAALAGFDWAIDQHRRNGAPDLLSNSWGIFQEDWDPVYATDPEHYFTRKVVEALDEGILVFFTAGNCGERCPDSRCGDDVGAGRSIWGANGHPRVITIGAGNIDNQLIGYSSQGHAALAPAKPDFLAPSHFQGYFAVDTGTSAACPVAAGAVATIKSAFPWLTQEQAKELLHTTALDLGPSGWDPHSGSGMIQPYDAFERLALMFLNLVSESLEPSAV